MLKIFASPSKYIQGKNALEDSMDELKKLGQSPLILCDDIVWDIVGKDYAANLEKNEFNILRETFNGEASEQEILRVSQLVSKNKCDMIIGLGGGKTIDTAKAIADRTNVPVVIAPTIASTDAPTSALSVIYTEEGVFEKYIFYKKNPDLVVVDTTVISKAPVRLLCSGIADALATWVEVRAVLEKHGQTMAGGQTTLAAQAIAKKCETVLFENSIKAVTANEAKVVTPAFEAVVEANTLLSGIGFESGGLAAAHAIHNGFTAIQGDIHHLTHGEKVAYGTLTQLFLENRSFEEMDRYISLYQKLGLPTTLKEMKLDNAPYDDLLKIGKLATQPGETIHQMPFPVSAQDVADALKAVDAYVTKNKKI